MAKRIVIVGGVAAGASAGAKARRTSEDVEIVMLEAGPYISFANCGLLYYVGGEIAERDKLLVVTKERFAKRFNVDVRTDTEVVSVDRRGRSVTVRGKDGETEQLAYDRLVLATGALPARPPIKGLDRDNVFFVRGIPDVDAIKARIARAESSSPAGVITVLVIGGGYIGLEAAEQFAAMGAKTTLVEMADQLMPAMDVEMAWPMEAALAKAGCDVLTSQTVAEIVERDGATLAVTSAGEEVRFDLAIVAVGVRPNVALAEQAKLALGASRAIAVDAMQRTNDPAIYAAGDNSECRHLVLGRAVNIPLAGPANKAGRVAGANAALDLMDVGDDDPRRLRAGGVLGTAIVRVGETVAAVTGLTASAAKREGIAAEVMYIPGASHASYYPGAARIVVKIVYSADNGRLLGAQAVGGDGVDKRIDVLATAIAGGMSVEDLEDLDLCYAPPFGSAKDLEILAGFAAANTRRGIMPTITPAQLLDALAGGDRPYVIDVRSPGEFHRDHLEGAVNIPIDELRSRIGEVPTDRPVVLYCHVGYRSYVVERTLMNRGYANIRNVQGGIVMIRQTQRALRKAPSGSLRRAR